MQQQVNKRDQQREKWVAFDKKVSHLKSKIFFNFVTFVILAGTLGWVYSQLSKIKTTGEKEISELTSYLSSLKIKSADIEAKINDAKKYKQIWQKSSDKKKILDGIKASDLNNIFLTLVEKHNIINHSIRISVPENLKSGIFDRQTLDIMLSTVSIDFEAINDVMAINFVKDFTDSIPGYYIINSFSIRKTKEGGYQEADLVSISSGKMISSISGKLDIYWYAFKRKNVNNDPEKEAGNKATKVTPQAK